MAELWENQIDEVINKFICKKDYSNIEHFIVTGGAGSGKTYQLIRTINYIYEKMPSAKVACITYTNVGVEEIKKRAPYEQLWVSTIHEFIWNEIKNYNKNLVESIKVLCKNNEIETKDKEIVNNEQYAPVQVQYKEYRNLKDGIISHNEVIKLGQYMFKNYKLLSKILSDKYDFIFIDEYQDTDKKIIDMLLDSFIKNENCHTLLGFFGDNMQAIYESGIGDINAEYYGLKNIEIHENRRCSTTVIDLLNKQRKLKQEPANNNSKGSVKFIYSNQNIDIDIIKKRYMSEWNFKNFEKTKELYLTKKLISKNCGFTRLLDTYKTESYADKLLGNELDEFAKQIQRIEQLIYYYDNNMYFDFINFSQYKITNIEDKEILKNTIMKLNCKKNNIGELFDIANKSGLCKNSDSFNKLKTEKSEFYNKITKISVTEAKKYFKYFNSYTPYSTQHGVKGAEFDNVFVVLDNGRWNKYNFKTLFSKTSNNTSIYERTKKLFYVCCSRAKENLVIYFPKINSITLNEAKSFFTEDEIIEYKENLKQK